MTPLRKAIRSFRTVDLKQLLLSFIKQALLQPFSQNSYAELAHYYHTLNWVGNTYL